MSEIAPTIQSGPDDCPPAFAVGSPPEFDAGTTPRTDTLVGSVVLLLTLTVLQRGIGFVREMSFCRFLEPEQLGLWNIAFGFLMLAGPLVVMSLPGSFGRYVERYRMQGHLRTFLRRTAVFCVAFSLPASLGVYLARHTLSRWIFCEPDRIDLVASMSLGVAAVVAFNFMICVFTSLRNVRLVSCMELINSITFGVAGGLLMLSGWTSAGAMVTAYTIACMVTALVGLVALVRVWPTFPRSSDRLPQRELWATLLPFAGWLMVINVLWNLFDLVDRAMIVHFAPGTTADALAAVGNYHSSRVVPLLLASVTTMIAGVFLPHLSHDWEAGRKQRVSERLNLMIKLWALILTIGGVVFLCIAPLLFQVALRGKYSGGLSVLPWTLTYCTWFGLAMLMQSYLWCAEKGRVASLVALAGVIVDVALGYLLLPAMGLMGAVLARSTANFIALFMMAALSRKYGFRIHRGTVVLMLLPACLALGPWAAMLILAVVILEACTTDRIFSHEEKQELGSGAARYLGKFAILGRRRWQWRTD